MGHQHIPAALPEALMTLGVATDDPVPTSGWITYEQVSFTMLRSTKKCKHLYREASNSNPILKASCGSAA